MSGGKLRNRPCPCGSGRKYKYCCLPRVLAKFTSKIALAAQKKEAAYIQKQYERAKRAQEGV